MVANDNRPTLLEYYFFIWLSYETASLRLIQMSHAVASDVCRYVCGYKNRFQNFIRYLREMGDEVRIFLHQLHSLSVQRQALALPTKQESGRSQFDCMRLHCVALHRVSV